MQRSTRRRWTASRHLPAATPWRKSSLSAFNGSCFEAARLDDDTIAVRDSKDGGNGPAIIVPRAAFTALIAAAKAGDLDSV